MEHYMKENPLLLFGYSDACFHIAEQLKAKGWPLVIADNDLLRVKQAQKDGFSAIALDYTQDEALCQAGVGQHVDCIFCLFEHDSENVFLTISARALAPELKIVAITESQEAEHKLRIAGADHIINPYTMSGRRIAELMRKPEVVDVLDHTLYGRYEINMTQIDITGACTLSQKCLSDIDLKKDFNLILLGIVGAEREDSFIFSVQSTHHRLTPGDTLVIIGMPNAIELFKDYLNMPPSHVHTS